MIPIYCLTLPDQPWKRAMAELHFRDFNIPVTFIEGFNGGLLGIQPATPHYIDEKNQKTWIAGVQLGCALSHIMALNIAIALGHPEFIVIEDDAVFPFDWEQKWSQLRSEIQPEVGCVQLEYMHADDKPSERVSQSLSRVGYPFNAGAIWWRRTAAKEAVKMLRPVNSPFDVMLMQRVFPFVGHLVATPALIQQRTASKIWPSSIHATHNETDYRVHDQSG
jgi:GR25 family glycosyltransferase involved in LPS biosynthesis